MEQIEQTYEAAPPPLISRAGLLTDAHAVSDDRKRDAVRQQAAVLEDVIDARNRAVALVERDPGLNGHGREARVKEIDRLTAKHLDRTLSRERPLGIEREAIEQRAARLERTLAECLAPGTRPDPDPVLSELRAREVRDGMLALPAERRMAVALEAADRGDLATLRALRAAPAVRATLTPEEWAQVVTLYQRRHYAAELRELTELNTALGALRHNEQRTRQLLGATIDPLPAQMVARL